MRDLLLRVLQLLLGRPTLLEHVLVGTWILTILDSKVAFNKLLYLIWTNLEDTGDLGNRNLGSDSDKGTLSMVVEEEILYNRPDISNAIETLLVKFLFRLPELDQVLHVVKLSWFTCSL